MADASCLWMDGAGKFNGGRRGWAQHRQTRKFGGRTPLYVTRRPRPWCRRGSGPGTATMPRRLGCGISNMAQAWGNDAGGAHATSRRRVGWQTARRGREAYEGNGPSAPESSSEGLMGPCLPLDSRRERYPRISPGSHGNHGHRFWCGSGWTERSLRGPMDTAIRSGAWMLRQ